MFNIKSKITSKLLETAYIWIYGSKMNANLEFQKFQNNSFYISNNEITRAFVNADFWEYLIGWEKEKEKTYNLTKLLANIKDVDQVILLKKITNPYQIELLRKKQYEKASIGSKLLQFIWSKKSVNKEIICDEFGISNETLVKWIDFIEVHRWIQKNTNHVAEDFKPYLSNLQNLKTNRKLSLMEYIQFQMALNKDNPVSTLTFNKNDLSYLINTGPVNLYKDLSYKIEGEELNFNIFPFTIFRELAKNNGYDYNDQVLKQDLENIFLKKAN